MAWQNSVGMGGSGGSAVSGSEAGGSGSQPQGTEYTLQGEYITGPDSSRAIVLVPRAGSKIVSERGMLQA